MRPSTARPLARAVAQPAPWRAVRHWLHELTVEVDAALRDGSAPASGIAWAVILRGGLWAHSSAGRS